MLNIDYITNMIQQVVNHAESLLAAILGFFAILGAIAVKVKAVAQWLFGIWSLVKGGEVISRFVDAVDFVEKLERVQGWIKRVRKKKTRATSPNEQNNGGDGDVEMEIELVGNKRKKIIHGKTVVVIEGADKVTIKIPKQRKKTS